MNKNKNLYVQNFKTFAIGALILSLLSITFELLYKVGRYQIRTYEYVLPRMHFLSYLVLFFGFLCIILSIILTIYNYHGIKKDSRCKDNNVKYRILIAGEVLFIIIDIVIVLV